MRFKKLTTLMLTSLGLTLAGDARADLYGFVLADHPTSASYIPAAHHRFNESGMPNRVYRISRGSYRVRMPLALSALHGGSVQVSSYGQGSQRCKVRGWGRQANVDLDIYVVCFDANGRAVDARFTALYHDATPYGEDVAFAWSNQVSPAGPGGYVPATYYRHNPRPEDPSGPNLWIRRDATGVYSVYMHGWDEPRRNFLVTAYGGNATHCNIADEDHETAYVTRHRYWIRRMFARVHCFDARGVRMDSRFTIAMGQARSFGNPGAPGASFLLDRPSASSSPAGFETSWNSHAGPTTTTSYRAGVGRYSVYFLGLAGQYTSATALVTARDPNGGHCTVTGWNDVWVFTKVSVSCFSPAGRAADSAFFLTFLSGRR